MDWPFFVENFLKNIEKMAEKEYNSQMERMEYISKSEKETGKIAGELAQKVILQQALDKATVVALEGELGAGKTTFTKAFAKMLGVKEKLTSPTFVILKSYNLKLKKFNKLTHIDAYRINSGQELKQLGIEEIISNPENIVLIEWAERVSDIISKEAVRVHIDHISESKRKIVIT